LTDINVVFSLTMYSLIEFILGTDQRPKRV